MVAKLVRGEAWIVQPGQRTPIVAGDVLTAGTRVETGGDAQLDLHVDPGVRITLERDARISVLAVGTTGASVMVERGLVIASAEDVPLEIRVRGSFESLHVVRASLRALHPT